MYIFIIVLQDCFLIFEKLTSHFFNTMIFCVTQVPKSTQPVRKFTNLDVDVLKKVLLPIAYIIGKRILIKRKKVE